MNEKLCTGCKQIKKLQLFSINRGKPRPKCKECRVKEAQEYYLKNLTERKEYHHDRIQKMRKCEETRLRLNKNAEVSRKKKTAKYREFMKEKKCERCGFNDQRALQWHHRNPKDKKFAIASVVRHKSWDDIIEEINKCECLCANCHFIEHRPNG